MSRKRVLILLNKRSGTLANSANSDEPEVIRGGFEAAGLEAEVRAADPRHADRQVSTARREGFSAIVVGGGDGTINAIANAIARTAPADDRMIFAVLPLGTHNHFAKELAVPADLSAAVSQIAAAIAADNAEPLDIAEINGTLLLNFSGIGLHPRLVESRDREHAEIRKSTVVRTLLRKFTKPLSMAIAFSRSLGDFRLLRLGIDTDGRRQMVLTPAVVIGNNIHQIEVFGVAELSACRRDKLNVYLVRVRTAVGLVRMVLAAAAKRLPAMREFECISAARLTIHHRRPTLKVSVDGEVMEFRTPLQYAIRKNALRVVRMAS